MDLTLDYLANGNNRYNVKVSDLTTLLKSHGFEYTGQKDSRVGQKWRHPGLVRVFNFVFVSGKASPSTVRDVYEACLEVSRVHNSTGLHQHTAWQPLDISHQFPRFEAFHAGNKVLVHYVGFPEFSREFEVSPDAGGLEHQLQRHIEKLTITYGNVCDEAVALKNKYRAVIARDEGPILTIKQEDLGIDIVCELSGLLRVEMLMKAIKRASKDVKTVADERLSTLLKLEATYGYKIDFSAESITLTHPDAGEGWSQSIDSYVEDEDYLITKAGYEALIKLETIGYPKPSDLVSSSVSGEFASAAVEDSDGPSTEPEIVVTHSAEVSENVSDAVPPTIQMSLKTLSVADFEKDPQSHLQIGNGHSPVSIKNEDGQTLAIIMPLGRHDALASVIGSKIVSLVSLEVDPVAILRSICEQTTCTLVQSKLPGNKPVGFMLPGSYEMEVAADMSATMPFIDAGPDNQVPDFEACLGADASADTKPREYSYQIVYASRMLSKVAEFRKDLADGCIKVVAEAERIIAIYIPGTLMDSVIPQDQEWIEITPNRHDNMYKSGDLANRSFKEFYKIQPQAAPFKNKIEFASKDPYGVVSWDSLLNLVKAGLLPAVPPSIIKKVEAACGQTKKPTPAKKAPDTSPVDTRLLSTSKNSPAGTLTLGTVVNVENLNTIQAKLALIKAARQLNETVSQVRESLRSQSGFVPVMIGDHKIFATSSVDFIENVRDIADTFGLKCASVEIDQNQDNSASSWMQAFKNAAEAQDTFTFIQDKSLGRNIVIVPANETMKKTLSALEIHLE